MKIEKQSISYDELLKKVQSLVSCYPKLHGIEVRELIIHKEQIDHANWHVKWTSHPKGDNNSQEILNEIRKLREAYDVETNN